MRRSLLACAVAAALAPLPPAAPAWAQACNPATARSPISFDRDIQRIFDQHCVDGTVWAWGENFSGQLGDGSTTQRAAPKRVPNLSAVKAIAAGSHHSLAVLTSGKLASWGFNDFGQLGDGTKTSRSIPGPVIGIDMVG